MFIGAFSLQSKAVERDFLDLAKLVARSLGPRFDRAPLLDKTPSIRWKLAWSDEFESDGLPDPLKWKFELGGDGWGNDEQQFYTDRWENARVEDGRLVIEARKEDFENRRFTSARMRINNAGWTYAKFEIKAKMPSGPGTWAAIWFMPTNADSVWPNDGEIDLVEYLGVLPDRILSSFQTQNSNWMRGNAISILKEVTNAENAFHVYTMVWQEDGISMAVDGVPFLVSLNPHSTIGDWPFTQPFNLILNLALGGYGGPIDETIFPQRLEIAYVRVYVPEKIPNALSMVDPH